MIYNNGVCYRLRPASVIEDKPYSKVSHNWVEPCLGTTL